jgi:hypothetical protein
LDHTGFPLRGRQFPSAGAANDHANRHLIVDQPAVHHPDHGGLGLVDDQVPGHAVALGDVPIAVGCSGGDPLASPRPLDLAPPESLPQDGALVFGDGPLDLQE